jgi:hypothetical protein
MDNECEGGQGGGRDDLVRKTASNPDSHQERDDSEAQEDGIGNRIEHRGRLLMREVLGSIGIKELLTVAMSSCPREAHVRHAKNGRSREVALHPSTVTALDAYTRVRDELCPHPTDRAFLITPPTGPS